MASIQPSQPENTEVVNILKRRCEVLEEQLARASDPKPKNSTREQTYAGRPVRRLISFFDSARDLIEENDRRLLLEFEALDGNERRDSPTTIEQDRLLRGYKELLIYVPALKDMMAEGVSDDLTIFLKNVARGSDMARSDDTGSLKIAIIEWVGTEFGVSNPPLRPRYKEHRGLENDFCGNLLCPAEFDWADLSVRANIRDGHPDFAVTAGSWPIFLYAEFKVQPDDIDKGLFRSNMLVKAYKHIFTSPTSVTVEEENVEPASHRAKRPNNGISSKKSSVACLLNMHSVTPRSIAYIAVQVRFSLSNLNSWTETDGNVSHRDFYNAIVDYFEVTPGPVAKRHVTELLQWWNKRVFRRSNRSSPLAVRSINSSVARLATQRAAKERIDVD